MLHLLGFLLLLLLRLLLGVLLLLLFLLLLVLFIPFRYDFQGHRYEEDTAAVGSVRWLFGLVSLVASYDLLQGFQMRVMLCTRWHLKSFGRNGKVDAAVSPNTQKKRDKEKQAEKKSGRTFRVTREKVLILMNASIRLLKRVTPRWVRLDTRIGFDDPADTGSLCAVLATLQALVHANPDRYKVHVVPVFEEAEASGNLELQGRLILWFIVWEGLKLAISRPFRQDIFSFLKPHAKMQGNSQTKQQVKTIQGGYEHV